METQDEDVQGKENKEDVVKLVEIVVEEYVKVPNTENVLDENVKDLDAEEYGKDTEGRRLLCDIFLWPLQIKETVETLPWNNTR